MKIESINRDDKVAQEEALILGQGLNQGPRAGSTSTLAENKRWGRIKRRDLFESFSCRVMKLLTCMPSM
jgi:hypothetical protein